MRGDVVVFLAVCSYVLHPGRSALTSRGIQEYGQHAGNGRVSMRGSGTGHSPAVLRYFVETLPEVIDTSSRHAVRGHTITVSDPARTVRVMEAGGPSGCKPDEQGYARLMPVRETALRGGCLAAVNAGFFTEEGLCIGNVVTNQKLIHTDSTGRHRANFGVKKNGELFVGYLPNESTLAEFTQLVTGAVWLVKNRQSYVNASWQAEGVSEAFVSEPTARMAIGHDASGNVVIVQIDGRPLDDGINLWDFAKFLIRLDIVNAINLDGGGSVTAVYNHTIVNYPYDRCLPDFEYRCERDVSTILCVGDSNISPAQTHQDIQIYLMEKERTKQLTTIGLPLIATIGIISVLLNIILLGVKFK